MTAVDRRPPAVESVPTGGRRVPSATRLALLAGLAYLPLIWFGYGTDIDITNIRRSGESILDGDYRYSRPPGAFPHEAITGLLDRIGGAVAVNIAAVAVAVVALVAVARILERHHGPRAARIAVLLIATQPWFIVAATSLGDYIYALAALFVGIDLSQRDRRVWAALAFGLAVGCRSATVLIVVAYLAADYFGDSLDDSAEHPASARRRAVVATGIGAAVAGAVWFVPPWLAAERTTSFLQNQLRAGDLGVMVARWGVKNIAFFGLVTIVVLVVRAPVLWDAVARFRSLVLVRFAVLAAVLTELLYLRFPWKPVHLLPVAVCLAILLALSTKTSNRLVAVLLVSQLLLGVVSVTIAEPDVADAATDGRFRPGVTWGVLVNEVECRLDPDFDGTWPDLDTPEADLAAVQVFACQARSWRAGAGPAATTVDFGP